MKNNKKLSYRRETARQLQSGGKREGIEGREGQEGEERREGKGRDEVVPLIFQNVVAPLCYDVRARARLYTPLN